jgi:hypothetical protein
VARPIPRPFLPRSRPTHDQQYAHKRKAVGAFPPFNEAAPVGRVRIYNISNYMRLTTKTLTPRTAKYNPN